MTFFRTLLFILLGGIVGASAAPASEEGVIPRNPAPAQPCGPASVGEGIVRDVTDGRTLVLADGRSVRLPAIETPLILPGSGGEDAALALAAKGALAALTLGQAVVLKAQANATDRYGRLRAHAYVRREGLERSVETDMLRVGFARVAPLPGEAACTAALTSEERSARDGKLGLWADPRFAIRAAADPGAMATDRGRFTLVEGKVRSVRESGGTIYVNFGGRWSEDFTVTIAKRNERMMSAAGLEPKRLEGRRLRVRGWIEERGGPWIDVIGPEQIEVLSGE